jgi:eukaryotic-like serine/threonine-protein kinase
MNRNRWKEVNNIFHAALDRPSSERKQFVHSASNGDAEIQEEVEHLLAADSQAGSYLETPIQPNHLSFEMEPALISGDVLCGRFQILRLLGEGGMGCVYEAIDSELRERVALKIIRIEIASHPEALARFRQEARLARQITHPNVCRTFDIEHEFRVADASGGKAQDIVFLTMEFLPGETLASRITRAGALPIQLALALAKQMADAILAANSVGIIHRDLKPANVMLVPCANLESGGIRAVVTDFGLARVSPEISPSSQLSIGICNSRPIGTISYMAPEQLEGKAVSTASDVYSFGLILFEMVTGRRAFPSNNFLGGIEQRTTGPPPSPRFLVPDVPQEWCRAIEACLRFDPAERPKSTKDVVAILEGLRGPSIASDLRSGKHQWLHLLIHTKQRILIVAIILIALVALFAGTIRLFKLRGQANLARGALVYLTPIENRTSEKDLNNLTELIKAGLAQSTQINIMDQGHAGDVMRQMNIAQDLPLQPAVAREIGMRTGAARIVFASVSKSGGQYELSVDIQQPGDTPSRFREHWIRSFEWDGPANRDSVGRISPQLLAAVQDASDWIRQKVGESADDIAKLDVPPEDVTTARWDALEEFVTAEKLQHKQATSDAVVALQNAVRLDPQFCLALARLGDLLVSLGKFREGYHAYSQALVLDQFHRLTRRERDRVKGTFANDTGDYYAAVQAYRDYAVYFENDYQGWFYQGYPLLMLGRTDEAIHVLEKAYSIDPSRGNAPWELARANIIKGNYENVNHWRMVLAKQGDIGTSSYFGGILSFAKHDYIESRISFTEIRHSARAEDHSWSYWLTAGLEADLGNHQAALTALNNGIQEDRSGGYTAREADKWIARAYIECQMQDSKQCVRDIERGLNLDSSLQRLTSAGTVIGNFICRHGRHEPDMYALLLYMQREIPREDYGVISDITRHRIRGEIALARDDVHQALNEFEAAGNLDSPIADHEYLGRAFALAAQQTSNSSKALTYRREAMRAYGVIALHSGVAWLQPTTALPGVYADQLHEYLRLALLDASTDQSTAGLCREYLAMRPAQTTDSEIGRPCARFEVPNN